MVVQGILALALALPTGLLFGVGYGTGVRIGYEQVYPLLFPKDSANRNVTPTVNNIKQINGIYNAIGGKEASQMGIAMGLQGAMEEIDRNPDFQALEELELRLSGRTQSRLGTEAPLKETSISDFPLGSSLDPESPNFNSELYILVKKEQAENAPIPTNLGNKTQLGIEREPNVTPAQLAHAKQLREDAEWTAWSTKLSKLKQTWSKAKSSYIVASRNLKGTIRRSSLAKHTSTMRNTLTLIRQMSNDYRHPNNNIRNNALQLRKEIANGNYKNIGQ